MTGVERKAMLFRVAPKAAPEPVLVRSRTDSERSGSPRSVTEYDLAEAAMTQPVGPIAVVRRKESDSAQLFHAFLAEESPAAASLYLDQLCELYVAPLFRSVVTFKFRSRGFAQRTLVEDVASDAMVAFLTFAESAREFQRPEPILNFEAFLAGIAARTCSQHFRRSFPAFHRTRNRVRYVLDHTRHLARWTEPDEETCCGLAVWVTVSSTEAPPLVRLERLSDFDDLAGVIEPARMLTAIFERAGGPLHFNELVSLVARLWNIKDLPDESIEDLQVPHSACPVDLELGRREWLGALWTHISELNLNQRIALLLNLRDGSGQCGISLLVATGVASLSVIARTLEYEPAAFAALWPRLPLSDLEIADKLQLSRQQVINLRKCAREKLIRRTAHDTKAAW